MSAETVHHFVLDEVDSTNAEGFRRAAVNQSPFWVLAARQSAGRGRRARPWVSPPGNFYGTLVLRLQEPASRIALRSFVAALALRDTLAQLIDGNARLGLKWPNDVLLNDRKVAGILLEAAAGTLCVGIGVNLVDAPSPEVVEAGAVLPSSLRHESGVQILPPAFLSLLSPAYFRWENRLVVEGFEPLRQEWLSSAARLGTRIRARTGSEMREGLFETIDTSGNLVLRMACGLVTVPAADVFF